MFQIHFLICHFKLYVAILIEMGLSGDIEKRHSNSLPGCCYKLFANLSIYKNKDIQKIILKVKLQEN